ncbi:hypothetical protein PINS_up003694 [Pythium insidiosum]|nr:hypothetical protein PINS_up003694 [Pythium insidiosum]
MDAADTEMTSPTVTLPAALPHHKFSIHSRYAFVKIAIISDDGTPVVSEVKRLKFALSNELRTIFGEVGVAQVDVDVLSLTKATKEEAAATAILRVRQSALHRLWGALTMCTVIDSKLCKLQVLHVSHSLLALASPRFM